MPNSTSNEAAQPSPAATFPRLLGDIGGTHARFAVETMPGAPLTEPRALRCREFEGPVEAIESYLASTGLPRPRWAAFGIATALGGDRIHMTNHSWSFSVEDMRARLDADRVLFVNDFTALALALPALGQSELVRIGGGTALHGSPIAVLGPGTGLGVSGLMPGPSGYLPISGEGGHVTLAASDDREAELIAAVRSEHPHVSAERVLSGPGLVALHKAICGIAGASHQHTEPPQVLEQGLSGACAHCQEALDIFCAMLGTITADLALTLGARGGVYVGGGLVQRLGDYFGRSRFRARFETKGRFSSYLAAIPTYAIAAPWPGIVGAGRALDMEERALGTGIASAARA
jgi:glucokinase